MILCGQITAMRVLGMVSCMYLRKKPLKQILEINVNCPEYDTKLLSNLIINNIERQGDYYDDKS